jgi:hypothetical protein
MEPAEPVFAAIGLWFTVLFVSNGERSVAVRTWNRVRAVFSPVFASARSD